MMSHQIETINQEKKTLKILKTKIMVLKHILTEASFERLSCRFNLKEERICRQ